MTHSAHPDPVTQHGFYADTPMKRLFAWLIDMVLIIIMAVLILPFTAFTGLFFFPFLLLVIGFAYRTLTITGNSATWGMRMMSIELRDSDGERFGFGQAFLHTLGYTISVAVAPLQLISVILMLLTAKKQGLTDMVMGAVMINKPSSH